MNQMKPDEIYREKEMNHTKQVFQIKKEQLPRKEEKATDTYQTTWSEPRTW